MLFKRRLNRSFTEAYYGRNKMTPVGLTERQREILGFIHSYASEKGYPPTIRQIGARFGIKSPNGVKDHLKALERKGEIKLEPNTARGIDLLGRRNSGIPLIGRIAAGAPILAAESVEDYLTIEKIFPIDGRCFALKVKGDSMIEEGIHNGDIVIVRPQSSAENGDIVVALIEDEVTVKTLFRDRGRIRLQPANPAHSPIVVRDVEIKGRVIGVIRTL